MILWGAVAVCRRKGLRMHASRVATIDKVKRRVCWMDDVEVRRRSIPLINDAFHYGLFVPNTLHSWRFARACAVYNYRVHAGDYQTISPTHYPIPTLGISKNAEMYAVSDASCL